jgi:hypothetical protein
MVGEIVVEALEEAGSRGRIRAAVHDQQGEAVLAQTLAAVAPDAPERFVEMMNHVHHDRKHLVARKSKVDKQFVNYFSLSVAKYKRSGSHLNLKAMRLSMTLSVLPERIVFQLHMSLAGVSKPLLVQRLLRECSHAQQRFQRLTWLGSSSAARVLHHF